MMQAFILSLFLSLSAFGQDLGPAESKLMFKEGMRLWQTRDIRENLEEALSKFEMAHSGDAKNSEILLYLTRGYYLLGDGHTTNDDLKKRFFEKGKEFGEKTLSLNEEFKKAFEKDGMEKALKHVTKEDSPVLFWSAANLAKWSKANGIFSSLKYKNQIIEMIKKVEELTPDYFHGAVPRYWGGFYAVAPSIAGGDMKKSKKNFEKAIKVAPEYLGTRVLYAELYWVKEDNKKEFRKQLEAVLAFTDSPAEIAPENKIEKAKAEKLLEKIDDLF